MIVRRLAAFAVLLAAGFAAALALAAPASAHATLVTSAPANGARLKAAPTSVSITFDEPVGLASIGYLHVTDQTGKRVETGNATHPAGDGTTIRVTLKSGLGDGTYTESYRVVSADSHPVAGVVRFVVGNGALTVTPVGGATNNHVTGALYDVARWVSFGGFAALGGVWLLLTVWTDGRGNVRARRVVWTGWGATVLGALAELLLQGPYAAASGPSGIAKWTLLDATLHSDYGEYHCVRLILLGVVAWLVALMLDDRRVLGQRFDGALWVPLIAIAYTFSATGHPNTTSPRWLSIGVDVLHLCAMATWIGALIMLAVAVVPSASANEATGEAVETVSRVAFVAVCVLAATGAYAAWHGVGTVHALLTTTYGVLVTVKVVLFAGLIVLGYASRRALRARLGERLRRSVLVEIVVALCVFAATAVLVAQPRGKEALAAQHLKPTSAEVALGGGGSATVTVDPGTHGNVTVTVELSGAAPQKLTGTATLPAKQLGPLPLTFAKQGANLYAASGVGLPLAGTWDIGLVITSSQFSATTADVHIHLY